LVLQIFLACSFWICSRN